MSPRLPRLQISTPSEPIEPGRGFYQLEEEVLYVQVGRFESGKRFYSYLESSNFSMEFDREGHLIFIELNLPRRLWPVDQALNWPTEVEPADIRWLDFRAHIEMPQINTNQERSMIQIMLSDTVSSKVYYLASTVVLLVDSANLPVGMMIRDINDDLAGAEIAAFRKQLRQE
jgi:hypothetical protein